MHHVLKKKTQQPKKLVNALSIKSFLLIINVTHALSVSPRHPSSSILSRFSQLYLLFYPN